MKYKLMRGKSGALGEFHTVTGIVNIFVDEIVSEARSWGCDYQDLKKMVILHEEAHSLHKEHGVTFLSVWDEEHTADQYAIRQFIVREGRRPSVPLNLWTKQEA